MKTLEQITLSAIILVSIISASIGLCTSQETGIAICTSTLIYILVVLDRILKNIIKSNKHENN